MNAVRCLALLAMLPAGAAGQAPARTCVWPGDPSVCSAWFVTEAGVHVRFTDVQPDDERVLVAYTVGWMGNVGPRAAAGVALFGGGEGEFRGGVAARARRWLSRRSAVDAMAGVHLIGDASSQDVRAGSPMVAVRLAYRDRLSAVARLDVLRLRCGFNCLPQFVINPNGTSTRTYLGAELGSQLGVAGFLLTAAVIGIAAAACC